MILRSNTGKDMKHNADALSRCPCLLQHCKHCEPLPELLQKIKKQQRSQSGSLLWILKVEEPFECSMVRPYLEMALIERGVKVLYCLNNCKQLLPHYTVLLLRWAESSAVVSNHSLLPFLTLQENCTHNIVAGIMISIKDERCICFGVTQDWCFC